MAFIDDLSKAVGMFNDGMERLATTNAFESASGKINEINQAKLNEMEKRQALQGVSQELAQGLLQANAPIAKIQAAFQAFGAPALSDPNEQIQVGVESEDPTLVSRGQKIQREQSRVSNENILNKVLATAQTKSSANTGKEFRTIINNRQQEFNRLTRDHNKAFNQADTASTALALKNPVADSAIRTMLAKASGEVGSLTDAERNMFSGSPALQRRAARLAKLNTLGTLPEKDRKDLAQLIELYKQNAKKAINKQAKDISHQLSKTTGMTPEESLRSLIPESNELEADEQKVQEPIAKVPIKSGLRNMPGFKVND